MDPNQPNSFMNLLIGDDTQQEQPGSNVPNYPPNWQYPPPPYPIPRQQNAYYPPSLPSTTTKCILPTPLKTSQTYHMEGCPHLTRPKLLLLLNQTIP